MMIFTEFPGGSLTAKSYTRTNKLCMRSDTDPAFSLDKKGKNSRPFSYKPGENNEEGVRPF